MQMGILCGALNPWDVGTPTGTFHKKNVMLTGSWALEKGGMKRMERARCAWGEREAWREEESFFFPIPRVLLFSRAMYSFYVCIQYSSSILLLLSSACHTGSNR